MSMRSLSTIDCDCTLTKPWGIITNLITAGTITRTTTTFIVLRAGPFACPTRTTFTAQLTYTRRSAIAGRPCDTKACQG